MKLKDTITLMLSDNYKDRLKGEYYQIANRHEGLGKMLKLYKANELPFKPVCSYKLLYEQYVIMGDYMNILEERACIENIELKEVE